VQDLHTMRALPQPPRRSATEPQRGHTRWGCSRSVSVTFVMTVMISDDARRGHYNDEVTRSHHDGLGVAVYRGDELARYGFADDHPFGADRHAIFWQGMEARGLADRVLVVPPAAASRDEIESFHTSAYADRVVELSRRGVGYLDYGDTPAFPGADEAAGWVVGSTLNAVGRLMEGACRRAFVPIAGLHHARRSTAGGFCVYNDCAIAIEILRSRWGVRRIAYVDIDAHHGDGVFYAFEEDPDVVIGDIHQDGRTLYPGTGAAHETGLGSAEGSKLNIPLLPGADDTTFLHEWNRIEHHIDSAAPEFVILQCGADGLAGDPLAHLEYSATAHRRATADLCRIADRHCGGKLLALGGGGYDPAGIADAWCAVVAAMLCS